MKSFTIDTDVSYTRPVFLIEGYLTVIDTGADIPVCTSARVLEEVFNASQITIKGLTPKLNVLGGTIKGRYYRVRGFKVGQLIYPEITFFVPNNRGKEETTFILSASMFHDLVCEIDMKNHAVTITIPDDETEVRIVQYDKNGSHIVLLNDND